ncbi:hypothetical protein EF912_10550 [Streptomyces sp. WAC07061]|uniref:DUF6114 domain-containing protein n=1 Tax=Streptomyces sp. WAC07061 TaxID=2487410 RepID=UPI000F79297B|nr:DUF6114 domain-containing protein [Streptomyces sp. WAC07061]RSS58409.1 hypothetical protein EF912_10550 [Streptomyces sp. WAC07061]
MNPEAPVRAADAHWLTVVHHRFRDWRGSRPFWAGLFTSLGGVPIAYFPYADLRLGNVTIAMATTAGAGSLIIGILLITLGIALWFQQGIRVFAGVAAILLALVSLPVSNLGGFFFGFLFSLLGGALALAWAPGKPLEEDPEEAGVAGDAEAAKAEGYTGAPLGVPHPRDMETPYATETTAHADGGRNSAG